MELWHHSACFFLEPNAPSNVGVTTVTVNSLTVTWTASSTAGVSYTVTLTEKDGTTEKSETDVSGTSKAVGGLTAGTQYTVVVVAVIGGQSSAEVNGGKFYTSKSEGDCIN